MERVNQWKTEFTKHKKLILLSLLFLAIAVVFDYLAGIYVTKTSGVAAPDLLLDYIPTLDLDFIYIYGIIIVITILLLYPLFFKVREFHKVASQFSLLVMVRSTFTIFTHLETPAGAFKFNIPNIISVISFQNDLFFSGHTAIPFLGFLLFKESKIRYFFLAASIILGATVLLMHAHYSIDVFSAYFITYGTFKIGEWFFSKINNYRGIN
jgi:hypothetical protein